MIVFIGTAVKPFLTSWKKSATEKINKMKNKLQHNAM